MSYDPRRGSSPYLGMDTDEPDDRTTRLAGGEQARPAVTEAQAPRPEGDVMPRTVRRSPRPAASRPAEPPRAARPVAPAPVAVPSPAQEPYRGVEARPQAGLPRPVAALASLALHVAALALRVAAALLAGIVILSAILTDSYRATLIGVLGSLSWLADLPLLSGLFVTETPFGGVLRGDMALASVVLFVADWLCLRLAASLRRDGRSA